MEERLGQNFIVKTDPLRQKSRYWRGIRQVAGRLVRTPLQFIGWGKPGVWSQTPVYIPAPQGLCATLAVKSMSLSLCPHLKAGTLIPPSCMAWKVARIMKECVKCLLKGLIHNWHVIITVTNEVLFKTPVTGVENWAQSQEIRYQ